MLTPTYIALGRRKVCQCKEKCATGIEYRDVSGEVEITLCANAARQLAIDTIDALIKTPSLPPLIKKLKTWSQEEEATIVRMLKDKCSQGQIGLELGRTTSVVRKKIAHMRKQGKLQVSE